MHVDLAFFSHPESVSSPSPVITLLKAIGIAEQSLGGKYNQWPAELKVCGYYLAR